MLNPPLPNSISIAIYLIEKKKNHLGKRIKIIEGLIDFNSKYQMIYLDFLFLKKKKFVSW